MPDLKPPPAEGILRDGWTTEVRDYVLACEWALGGKALIIGDAIGGLFAYDGKSGERIWGLSDQHDGGLLTLEVQPKGELLATAGQDGRVQLLRAGDGAVVKNIDLGNQWVEHLAWSNDGELLAVACSRLVYVFDSNGTENWRSDPHPSTVSALAWSGNAELASACYGRVIFFDAFANEEKQRLEWKGSLVSMVLSPDGDIVACGSQDNSVHFWRRSTGEDSMMSGYPGKPSQLAFDHSGTLLATSGGEAVTVWSFAGSGPEGTRPGSLELHTESISSLAFAKKGMRLASGSRDGSVVIWKLQQDGGGNPIGAAITTGLVSAISWRPDGRALATANQKGAVTVFRLRS